MTDPRGAIASGILIVAMLYAVSTFNAALRGEIPLSEALKPAWTNFALAYPTVFAFFLVIGTLLFGSAFVAAMDAI